METVDGNDLALGIDIGTTSVKVALLNIATKQLVGTRSRETNADIISEAGSRYSEQNVHKIITSLQFCISQLPRNELQRVIKIGVSGQMHGILFWKRTKGWTQNVQGRFEVGQTSQLITWQDGRCGDQFIRTLPKPNSHQRLASGMGIVTTFWLQRHEPVWLEQYDCAGTIQDYVVSMLCGLESVVMSSQNASSWGYFDTQACTWNRNMYAIDIIISIRNNYVRLYCNPQNDVH